MWNKMLCKLISDYDCFIPFSIVSGNSRPNKSTLRSIIWSILMVLFLSTAAAAEFSNLYFTTDSIHSTRLALAVKPIKTCHVTRNDWFLHTQRRASFRRQLHRTVHITVLLISALALNEMAATR